ncbi:MAG TPA: polyphosphate kinase 2 family protein [Planctomycetaceae bacterium]|nr:polyphosphate kinase 2 family protein [Planctomycetaceae bacterium]
MQSLDEILDRFRVEPGKKCRLKDYNPGWEGDEDQPEEERREFAGKVVEESVAAVSEAQELLYAADSWSVLVIFQALDAAGKDGTIKHVMSGVNPQGVTVASFKQPSTMELDHDFLWRCNAALPERGRIGIFNRSYYEEVLVVKVHPELVAAQRIPNADADRKKFWKARYASINQFEEHLARNGTKILKFFLHVSKDEQRRRFLKRLEDPDRHWKFSEADLHERSFWDDYQKAYGEMLTETSTKYGPWHVIPADHKWVSRAVVAKILAREIKGLKLKRPELSPEETVKLAEYREQLLNEDDGK